MLKKVAEKPLLKRQFIIITTINPKSRGISEFEKMKDWHIVIVGDQKSFPIEESKNLTFLSVEKQKALGFSLAEKCPYNHYARKNIGYLYAICQGAEVIYDTDDDNFPLSGWELPTFSCQTSYDNGNKFLNIYKYFTDQYVWPRGFPLDEVLETAKGKTETTNLKEIGVWQGLADHEPDVDAIYRLLLNEQIVFQKPAPVYIDKDRYCPFNSQNTFWNSKVFPLLYLPSTVNFRFTDILRSYIAQRILWELNLRLGFTHATVYQERNDHNLMRDFRDEIPIYLEIKNITNILNKLSLSGNIFNDLFSIYLELRHNHYISDKELVLLNRWKRDYIKGINDRK